MSRTYSRSREFVEAEEGSCEYFLQKSMVITGGLKFVTASGLNLAIIYTRRSSHPS